MKKTILLIFIFLLNISIYSYSIKSGVTNGCHEGFLIKGYLTSQQLEHSTIPYPPLGDTWDVLSGTLLPIEVTETREKFYLTSLVIGVRAPDTDGHSLFNIAALRETAVYPDEQYNHFLRGQDDDYVIGDFNAYNKSVARIKEVLDKARAYFLSPQSSQIITVKVTIDYYNQIDVQVWAPAYYMGYALHIIHDSFAHTIRSTSSGYKEIVHVLNYAEAIYGDWNEERDGLKHSMKMDECTQDTPIVLATREATINFFDNVYSAIETGNYTNINTFFSTWLSYTPGSNYYNNYNNEIYANYIRENGDEPYVESIFSCTGSQDVSKSSGKGFLIFFAIMFSIAYYKNK